MMNFLQYRRCVLLSLIFLWPPTLWAASLSFGDSMQGISVYQIAGWLVISTISGVSSLFYRLHREIQRTKGKLPDPIIFVLANITGSYAFGLIAMFGGEYVGSPGLLTACSIAICSFGGAAALEQVVERRLKVNLERESQMGPLDPPKP